MAGVEYFQDGAGRQQAVPEPGEVGEESTRRRNVLLAILAVAVVLAVVSWLMTPSLFSTDAPAQNPTEEPPPVFLTPDGGTTPPGQTTP